MIDSELEKYIPKFLPEREQHDLFSDLKQLMQGEPFSKKNFYATYGTLREPYLDQGDGIDNLPIVSMPMDKIGTGKGFILSNTCDVSFDNNRAIPMRIIYAPILNLSKYESLLRKKGMYEEDHIRAIKSQQITHIMYLPYGSGLGYEAIVPLDQIQSIDSSVVDGNKLQTDRLFQLSRTGWYVLLIKITHHFARTNNELLLNRSPLQNP